MKQIKVIISLILCLVMILGMSIAVFADNDYIEIKTPEDLIAIQDNTWGKYILCNDIDLDSYAWQPFEFNGVLYGDGHSILNVHIRDYGFERRVVYDCNHKEYEACFAGLFSVLDGAEISNLNLYNVDINIDLEDESAFTGLLAGFVENSMISNVNVYGNSRLSTSGHCFGTGGMAGYGGNSRIQDCIIDVMLTCVDEDVTYKDEQFMGGAYALGYIDLVCNTVKIQGFDADHGYVHDGGLVGSYYKYDGDNNHGCISENNVEGFITFYEDNKNRRAYCSAYIGEIMQWTLDMDGNHESFTRDEIYDYSADLGPHWDCANPDMYDDVVEADYSQFDKYGYTIHTCKTCGFTYMDAYKTPLVMATSAKLNLSEIPEKLAKGSDTFISVDFEPLNASPKKISIVSDSECVVVDEPDYFHALGSDTLYRVRLYLADSGTANVSLVIDGQTVDTCTLKIGADFGDILNNYWYYGAVLVAVIVLGICLSKNKGKHNKR